MYDPTPFFFARIFISAFTFVLYPVMVTLTVFWFLGMPIMGINGFLQLLGILSLIAFVGSALGISIGAIFPNPFAALNVN
jgi:hypothetical protein